MHIKRPAENLRQNLTGINVLSKSQCRSLRQQHSRHSLGRAWYMRLITRIHFFEGSETKSWLYIIPKSLNATSRATVLLSSKADTFYYFKIPVHSSFFPGQLLKEGFCGWKKGKLTVQKGRRWQTADPFVVNRTFITVFSSGFHQILLYMQSYISVTFSVHFLQELYMQKKIKNTSELCFHMQMKGFLRKQLAWKIAGICVLFSNNFYNINSKL